MSNINQTLSEIAVILPCLNEQENIGPMYAQLKKYVPSADLIFVDDGSTDATWQEILKLSQKDASVQGLRFSRNFGQQAALEAGLRAANAQAVILMDCDLQHPVGLLPRMIEIWKSGKLIVQTQRQDPPGRPIKKLLSNSFYKVFNWISEVKLTSASSDFCLLDLKVVRFLNTLEQRSKFYRGILPWSGFPSATIEYQAADRTKGESSYTFSKMFELARVGITYFSYLPLKLIVVFGIMVFITSSAFFLVTLISKFLYPNLFSSAALFGSFIIANSGIIIIILGIIALYQVNLFRELQGLPSFVITDKTNTE
jgi:glycosyltransferase involved in cell wall biosynthesis